MGHPHAAVLPEPPAVEAAPVAGNSNGPAAESISPPAHGVDVQRCVQIYYDAAGDGRIELAWVGEHRPTVSEDT